MKLNWTSVIAVRKLVIKGKVATRVILGGLGLLVFLPADRWSMESRTNKFGIIWGMMYGVGRMDYHMTTQYPGSVYDDRFEDLLNRMELHLTILISKLEWKFIIEDRF